MDKMTRSPLFLMALTIFIDFAGFGIILPLLPFWAQRFGAGPVQPWNMVDKSINPLRTHFGPVLVMRQSRQAISLWSEAPSDFF